MNISHRLKFLFVFLGSPYRIIWAGLAGQSFCGGESQFFSRCHASQHYQAVRHRLKLLEQTVKVKCS